MEPVCIGLISDTHGLLRPQAIQVLQGVRHIIHAGDIGNRLLIEQLEEIAPVTAVCGNNDKGAWAEKLPAQTMLETGGIRVHVLHDLKELGIDPETSGVQVVVSGHSHRPSVNWKGSVLYVNPGSAGPRRFTLPVTLALLEITGGRPQARILPLLP